MTEFDAVLRMLCMAAWWASLGLFVLRISREEAGSDQFLLEILGLGLWASWLWA